MYNRKDRSSQWLEIRVPVEYFDLRVESIFMSAGRREERRISIEDVTDQYMDTEMRLAVKRISNPASGLLENDL